MKSNAGEIHIGPMRELYKYINLHAGTPTKARSSELGFLLAKKIKNKK